MEYYCDAANRVPDIQALGAGDYGSSKISVEGMKTSAIILWETVIYIAKCGELSAGIGQGIGFSGETKLGPDTIGASLQYSSNYIEIRIDDGKLTFGRSISAEAYIEIVSGKLGYAKKELDNFDQNWVLDEESSFKLGAPTTSIGGGVAVYFIIGGSIEFSLNFADFKKHYPEYAEEIEEILNERQEN